MKDRTDSSSYAARENKGKWATMGEPKDSIKRPFFLYAVDEIVGNSEKFLKFATLQNSAHWLYIIHSRKIVAAKVAIVRAVEYFPNALTSGLFNKAIDEEKLRAVVLAQFRD